MRERVGWLSEFLGCVPIDPVTYSLQSVWNCIFQPMQTVNACMRSSSWEACTVLKHWLTVAD